MRTKTKMIHNFKSSKWNRNSAQHRKIKFNPGIMLLGIIAVIVLGIAGYIFFTIRSDEVSKLIQQEENIRFIVALEHESQLYSSNVFIYNPDTVNAALFDVAINTGTLISSYDRIDRIDRLYNEGNFEEYQEEVARLFNKPIHFMIRIDETQIERLIDLAEGITLNVNVIDFDSVELFGELSLLIADNALDGHIASFYVDTVRQIQEAKLREKLLQKFVVELFTAIGAQTQLLLHPHVFSFVERQFSTSLRSTSLAALITELGKIDFSQIITYRTDGVVRNVDIDGTIALVLFPHFEGEWFRDAIDVIEETIKDDQNITAYNDTFTIAVFNGTTNGGLATRTAELFRGYGLNVIEVGNAERNDIEYTQIIDTLNNRVFVQQVADIIGAGDRVVDGALLPAENQDEADVTVILGKDFDGLYVRE